MDNLIEIWGYKNTGKPGKKLKFDEWSGQSYWIDPAIVDYVDPVQRTIHCDNIVFKLYNDKAVQDFIKKVND